MHEPKPFFGETTDRNKAFAGIGSFELTVIQDRFEMHTREPWQRESRYTKADVPRHLTCVNKRLSIGAG